MFYSYCNIIIVSYNYLVAEHKRIVVYLRDRDIYYGVHWTEKNIRRPTMPRLAFFDGDTYTTGGLLILDQAECMTNIDLKRHAAVAMLRERMPSCVMLLGVSIDNVWKDGYGLLRLLRGHPFSTLAKYVNSFTEKVEGSKRYRKRKPTFHQLKLLNELFDACTLRGEYAGLNALLSTKAKEKMLIEILGKNI